MCIDLGIFPLKKYTVYYNKNIALKVFQVPERDFRKALIGSLQASYLPPPASRSSCVFYSLCMQVGLPQPPSECTEEAPRLSLFPACAMLSPSFACSAPRRSPLLAALQIQLIFRGRMNCDWVWWETWLSLQWRVAELTSTHALWVSWWELLGELLTAAEPAKLGTWWVGQLALLLSLSAPQTFVVTD